MFQTPRHPPTETPRRTSSVRRDTTTKTKPPPTGRKNVVRATPEPSQYYGEYIDSQKHDDSEDEKNRWVTVFGFPQQHLSIIVSEMSSCGDIMKKKAANNQGNWVHFLYKTSLQAEKALGKNGMIIDSWIMIGVMRTKKEAIAAMDKVENMGESMLPPQKKLKQKDYIEETTMHAPQPDKSMISKFLDYVVGI